MLSKLSDADDDLWIARRAMEVGDITSAEATARRLVVAAPKSAEAHHILGLSLLRQGKPRAAIDPAMRATELAPSYAEAYHTLALCQTALRNNETAVQTAMTACDLVPNYAEAHFTLGTILQNLDRTSDAEASFRAAIAAKPDYAESFNQLGTLLQDQQRHSEAEVAFRSAISFRPDFMTAHDNLGFLMRQMGRPVEAAESFKIAHSMFEPHLVLRQPEGKIARSFVLARWFARVCAHLFLWLAGFRPSENALTDHRLLHQASNGKSSDLLSRFLAIFAVRSPQFPWQKSDIFSWIQQSDVPEIMRALDQDGLYVFKHPLPDEIVREMTEYAEHSPARIYPIPLDGQTHAVFDPEMPLASGYRFEEPSILQQPAAQKLMGDPLLQAIVQAYLGVESKLAYISMWWSAVFERNPTSHMAQLFHADLAHIKWLIIFVYLTDVHEGTGHHTFVKGSHKTDADGYELRRRGLVRVSDEDIHRIYGEKPISHIFGPKGTVFIADTRAYHKGNIPETAHRLMFQLYHVNSLFPDDLKISKQRKIKVVEPTLAEMIGKHPAMFDGYSVEL